MIKEYKNGTDFLNENLELINQNKYQAMYFKYNSALLENTDDKNYAIKCKISGKQGLILKVEPFNALVFGGFECVREIIKYIVDNKYNCERLLAEESLAEKIIDFVSKEHNFDTNINLIVDYMECKTVTDDLSNEVEKAIEYDVDEIFDCMKSFVEDTGIKDSVDKSKIEKEIEFYRVLRKDGKIISFAKARDTEDIIRKVSSVYTRTEYRGNGYARKVVNSLTNEIINQGKIATLNVDRANPISNHLYSSIGYEKIFSMVDFEINIL